MNAVDTRLYSLSGDLGMLQGVLNSLASEGVTPADLQKIRDDKTVRRAVVTALGRDPMVVIADETILGLRRRYQLLAQVLLGRADALPPNPHRLAAWGWVELGKKAQKVIAYYLPEQKFRDLVAPITPLHRTVLLWVWTRDEVVTFASIGREFAMPRKRAEVLYMAAYRRIVEEVNELFYDELVVEKTGDAVLSVPVELLDLSETTLALVLESAKSIRELMYHNRASLRGAVSLSAKQVEEVCSRLERIDIHLN